MTVSEAFAFVVIALWPIIPLWWIPVHGANRIIRRLGVAIYPIVFILWALCASLIYVNRTFLLGISIDFPVFVRALGIFFISAGIFLQLWTLKVLTIRIITGVPEIINGEKSRLITKGPFSRTRHPTYISHTTFFVGVFLATGIVATGSIALADFFIAALIIIPLEEKELQLRFGDEYRLYASHTSRFFPRIGKSHGQRNKSN